mgnify:CR=1 FL=1
MKNDISVDSVLNNLSSIIRMGNFLEEKVAGKLFEDIETMILNQQKHDFPDMKWQTMIWDVCANFEYKELWFAPKQWIHFDQQDELISDKNFDIFDSYAFFKLTHYDRGSHYNSDEDFRINNNRFPTANFFRHEQGYITLQFFLNYNLIRKLSYKREGLIKEIAEMENYRELCEWNYFRQNTLMQYQKLAGGGFELDNSSAFWWLKIDQFDSTLVIQEYNQGLLENSLTPIQNALKKINENFWVFDEMQQKAKQYYLEIAEI